MAPERDLAWCHTPGGGDEALRSTSQGQALGRVQQSQCVLPNLSRISAEAAIVGVACEVRGYGHSVTRIARSSLMDGFFHAYARGVPRQAIYVDELDFEAFMTLLGRTERRFDWHIRAACLMPNHYHLVLEATVAALSAGMHRLNGLYAQRFNRRYSRYGHLFASRFGARLIEEEPYFETVCRYVLENPVRAGLCETVEDWPWLFLRT